MTRKEAIARKAAWALALSEGRVVRYNGGMTLTSYPTVEAAQLALLTHARNGDNAEIVVVDCNGTPN